MKRIVFLHTIGVVGLFLFSFTQIDLGLALTRFPQLFKIQSLFQSIGYFNRPLSTFLYLFILCILFSSYLLFLYLIKKGSMSVKDMWILVILTACLLVFSYNAFSHDFFNYIFDAKIFTLYGKNPYLYKALDFPKDPMLSFMHWTHRTYPYGPLWLAITIPISYIGNQIFIVTFLLFKILVGISYLGSVYFINKIVHKIDSKTSTLATAFFALNPLILIESLVSGHLDIFMVFMVLISLFYLVQKRYLLTSMFLIFSIATKFATVFLLPVFLAVIVLQYMKEKITWPQVSIVSLVCLIFSVFAATQKSGNFQPWYLMVLIPFSALLVRNTYIFSASFIFSFSALMSYIPYLYLGHWDEPVPQLLSILYLITAIVIIIVWSIIYFGKTRFKNNVD